MKRRLGFMKVVSLIITLFVFYFLKSDMAFAASTASITGTATQTVLASIAIVNTSGLVFVAGSPGDAASIVPAGTVENANNASFTVTGQASRAYTITLPTTINMVNGAATIVVNAFTSFPATTGTLSAGGTQLIFVGATRAALAAAQLVGNYTGTFTVTVTY